MMRFVIVDDDKAAANALAKKLAAYDETELCGIALNGLDGQRMINETRPDVLFLDIELPDISGIEFLEHVNCLPQYKCRTVMYTAHDRFMLSAFRNKAFDYLMKPIDDTELRNIVRRVCIEMLVRQTPSTTTPRREAKPNWRKPLTKPSTTKLPSATLPTASPAATTASSSSTPTPSTSVLWTSARLVCLPTTTICACGS